MLVNEVDHHHGGVLGGVGAGGVQVGEIVYEVLGEVVAGGLL